MSTIIIILGVVLLLLRIKIQKLEKNDTSYISKIGNREAFLLATTYTFSKMHGVMNKDNTLNGKFLRDRNSIECAKSVLNSGYGVDDKESAKESIEWLINEGHNESYKNLMDTYYAGNTQLSYIEIKTLLEIKEKFDEKAIIGWDLVRANHLSIYSYMCGYLNEEEMLNYSNISCNRIYRLFDSWNDFIENVALGHKFFVINIHGLNEEQGNSIRKEHMDIFRSNEIYGNVEWEWKQ